MILTIDQRGMIAMLQGEHAALPLLAQEGRASIRRASHILPADFWLRLCFRLLRLCCGERGMVARWMRGWRCRWRVQVVHGPCLGEVASREQAVAAEIAYLEQSMFGGSQ